MPSQCRRLLLLLVLLPVLLVGCGNDGAVVGTWWGPLAEEDGEVPYAGGRGFRVQGFAARVQTEAAPLRDLLWVALVGADAPVSCSSYTAYLSDLVETQAYFDEVQSLPVDDPSRPSNAESFGYVCQSIQAASREAFGGEGNYRAVHLLMDLTDGGPSSTGIFRSAQPGGSAEELLGAELLAPSTYVARFYERSMHGEGLLPDATPTGNAGDPNPVTACPAILANLLETGSGLPDAEVPVLNAAAHRYYHRYSSEETLPFAVLDSDNIEVPTGVVAETYDQLAVLGGEVSLAFFMDVAGAVGSFPYEQVLLSTRGAPVDVAPCSELTDVLALSWAELPELGWVDQQLGDDDDSAGDDDDSADGN